MESIGQNLYVTGWTVENNLSPQAVEAALMHLAEQIRIDTGGMPCQVWNFPIVGKGSAGVTALQPLVEADNLGYRPVGAVIGNTWSSHNHVFFLIASCRKYDNRIVGDWLSAFVGKIVDYGKFDLTGAK